MSFFLTLSGQAVALGYDGQYNVYHGDVDGDGDLDVYIRRNPTIVLLHGDITTPIKLPDPVENALLRNDGNDVFVLDKNPTSAEKSLGRSWIEIAGDILLGDFNADGVPDIYLVLSEVIFSPNIEDFILYGTPLTGNQPLAIKRVDEDVKDFLSQVDAWIKNNSYFEDNAPTMTQQIPQTTGLGWLYYAQYFEGYNAAWAACQLEHDDCYSFYGRLSEIYTPSECDTYEQDFNNEDWCDRFGYHVYGYTESMTLVTVTVPDYSVFNPNAVEIAQGALGEAVAAAEVISRSSAAQEIIAIFEEILGVEILGGVLDDPNERMDDEDWIEDDSLGHMRLGRLIAHAITDLAYLAAGSPTSPGTTNKVVLTFDDGPSNPASIENKILDVLDENVYIADFYLLGERVGFWPASANEIKNRGHKIQNHSWDHANMLKLSQAEVSAQIGDAQNKIIEKTGVTPTKFRPPYGAGGGLPSIGNGVPGGSINSKVSNAADANNLEVVVWDIDTRDWERPRGLGDAKLEQAKRQFERKPSITNKYNILLHSVHKETANDLQDFLDFLELNGYEVVPP